MKTSWNGGLSSLLALGLLLSCAPDSDHLPSAPGPSITAHRAAAHWSPWSEPVNVGAPINSVGDDSQGTLSPSGLSLYFHSDRTDLAGAQGGNDIWVSRRACRRCPWQTPVNLGSVINTSANENAPTFSNDERLMFFVSNRAGGHGRADIYLSHRADPTNDLGWETPENLGPDVNTADAEASPAYLGKGTGGHAQLYFSRGVVMEQKADIFVASVTRRGVTLGPAVAVSELNDPTVNDAGMTVRHDGKELIFWSNRDGADGNLFVSTRGSVRDRWSTPVKLPAPLNTEFGEINARLSKDGRTLLLTSTRPGGLGGTQFGFDIWMSTRTPSGDFDADGDDDDDHGSHR
ncbi:MAG: hypothetical protein DME07_25340 [Candidatus Rokuibacteriota bacterium]|nr:MAG: hypothetical protein DME07_25340 [Candidatus Rokubacteria bacterium]